METDAMKMTVMTKDTAYAGEGLDLAVDRLMASSSDRNKPRAQLITQYETPTVTTIRDHLLIIHQTL